MMTQEEELQVERLTDTIFEALPDDGEISHLLSALIVVVGFTLCNISDDKKQALENAETFHTSIQDFINGCFDAATKLDS